MVIPPSDECLLASLAVVSFSFYLLIYVFRQAKSFDNSYYSLGDVVVASHGKPGYAVLLVKELESGALKAPSSFSEIWNDRGSGADSDVRIMRMNPPYGYTCLGNVAVRGYSTYPSAYKYRLELVV